MRDSSPTATTSLQRVEPLDMRGLFSFEPSAQDSVVAHMVRIQSLPVVPAARKGDLQPVARHAKETCDVSVVYDHNGAMKEPVDLMRQWLWRMP